MGTCCLLDVPRRVDTRNAWDALEPNFKRVVATDARLGRFNTDPLSVELSNVEFFMVFIIVRSHANLLEILIIKSDIFFQCIQYGYVLQ